jgi:hypothetical protein
VSQENDSLLKRVTVLVPVFNNERYIGTLLRGLIDQWRTDFELLIIDDNSSDQSFEVARDLIAAYPDVDSVFIRNSSQMGMKMLPVVMQHASADIIIQADSDDIALPNRLETIVSHFDADSACRMVVSNAVLLSEDGLPYSLVDCDSLDRIWTDPIDAIKSHTRAFGAVSAFHRTLITEFPLIDVELVPYGFDLLIPFRALLLGTLHYCAEPLVGWRQHAQNTHRLAGARDSEGFGRERHAAFEVMAFAQTLRDLEHFRHKLLPETFDQIMVTCQQSFLKKFEKWARSRNSLKVVKNFPSIKLNSNFSTGIPPIVTLNRGELRYFGQLERLGSIAHLWPGIYAPEFNFNWTASSFLILFNVNFDDINAVELELGAGVTHAPQKLQISINFSSAVSFFISAKNMKIKAHIPKNTLTNCLVILGHVPEALRPSEINNSPDQRLLGIRLCSIRVMSMHDDNEDHNHVDQQN